MCIRKMKMKKIYVLAMILVSFFSVSVFAFQSNEERINNYVSVLESGDQGVQEQMLNRLQWSGLSDPALFDVVEKRLLEHYNQDNPNGHLISLMSFHARALGYSGNEKYRSTLAEVAQNATDNKVRKHAKKALSDLTRWAQWLATLPQNVSVEAGQSIEVATYLHMLNVDNAFVQRLAARAIFHEKQRDKALIAKAVELIRARYLETGLDGETEDTIAWLCKAIGVAGSSDEQAFLAQVAENSPSPKIAKYAGKYSR